MSSSWHAGFAKARISEHAPAERRLRRFATGSSYSA